MEKEIYERAKPEKPDTLQDENMALPEEMFRALFEFALDGIFSTRPDGRIDAANPAACKILGMTEEEIIAAGRDRILNLKDPRISVGLKERTRDGRTKGEITFLRKDGIPFPVEFHSRIFRDGRGELRAFTIFRDITERLQAEEELRRSEERFSKLFQTSPAAVAITRLKDHRLADVNKAWEEITGLSRGEVIGHTARELNIWVSNSDREKFIHKLREQGTARSYEFQIRHKSGKVIDALFSAELIEIADEQYILSLAQDISKRKQTERELRESEERFRLTFDQSPIGAAMVSMQYKFLRVNEVFCRITGYGKEELIGLGFPDITHPNDLDKDLSLAQRLSTREIEYYEMDKRYIRKDGRIVWVHLVVRMVTDSSGQPLYFLPTVQDITEQKRAERAIQLYQKKLQSMGSEIVLAAAKERRHLAGEVHDRITQSLGLAKIKISSFPRSGLSPQKKSTLNEIRNLIESLIQESRSLIFEISPPLLYEMGLEAAVEWLAERFKEQHGIPVLLEIKGKGGRGKEDLHALLFQAVRELLNNIRKHSKARQARIILENFKNEIRVTVQDDGVGFATSGRRKVFLTSFGLFHIQEQIKHIGGNFRIVSSPGKGTRAILVAPIKNGRKSQKGGSDGKRTAKDPAGR